MICTAFMLVLALQRVSVGTPLSPSTLLRSASIIASHTDNPVASGSPAASPSFSNRTMSMSGFPQSSDLPTPMHGAYPIIESAPRSALLRTSAAGLNPLSLHSETGGDNLAYTDKDPNVVNIKNFGAKGNGVDDDTNAIMAAYNFAASKWGRTLLFPPGNYITNSQLIFKDVYFMTFLFMGGTISGNSQHTTYDSVVKIINGEMFNWIGSVTISADSSQWGPHNDPNLYSSCLYLTTEGGGKIMPKNGIFAYADFYGLGLLRCSTGLRIGEAINDCQIAEMCFHGLKVFQCPKGISQSGSQAVVSYLGCQITATEWPQLRAPIYTSFELTGGAAQIIGGEIDQDAASDGVVFDFRPSITKLYGNPYPILKCSNALIEAKSPMLIIRNPTPSVLPTSSTSSFSLLDCCGYVGELPAASSWISIFDNSFCGKIILNNGCTFYSGGDRKKSVTVDSKISNSCQIDISRKAFQGGNWPQSLRGIVGGQAAHDEEIVFEGRIANLHINTGKNYLMIAQVDDNAWLTRYPSLIPQKDGIFTVPSPSLKTLKIEASIGEIITGTPNGKLYIYDITSSKVLGYGMVTPTALTLIFTTHKLTSGHQFGLIWEQAGEPVTLGGGLGNHITIQASTD